MISLGVAPATATINRRQNYSAVTCPYTTTANDQVVSISGTSGTITVHTAIGNQGQTLTLLHSGTSLTQVYTLVTTGGQLIGTVSSGNYAFYTNSEELTLCSNNVDWPILNHVTTTGESVIAGLTVSPTSNYTFTISSATVVAGDVYSNNGQSFVISAGTTSTSVVCCGTGAPAASGTLTRTFGTGASSLTFSSVATSTTAKGAITADNFIWWRSGKYVNYRYDVNWATGTQGTGDNRYFYPTGLQPDLTNFQTNPTTGNPTKWSVLGNGQVTSNNNTLRQNGQFISANNLSMSLYINTVGMQGSGNYAISSQTAFSIIGSYPVTGWQP